MTLSVVATVDVMTPRVIAAVFHVEALRIVSAADVVVTAHHSALDVVATSIVAVVDVMTLRINGIIEHLTS